MEFHVFRIGTEFAVCEAIRLEVLADFRHYSNL